MGWINHKYCFSLKHDTLDIPNHWTETGTTLQIALEVIIFMPTKLNHGLFAGQCNHAVPRQIDTRSTLSNAITILLILLLGRNLTQKTQNWSNSETGFVQTTPECVHRFQPSWELNWSAQSCKYPNKTLDQRDPWVENDEVVYPSHWSHCFKTKSQPRTSQQLWVSMHDLLHNAITLWAVRIIPHIQ